MGHEAVLALVERGEIRLQALGDVVRVEDGELGGVGQAASAHEGDVDPGDEQNAGAAPRRGGDGADGIFAAEVDDGMAGEEGHEVFRHADGAHAGTAAAVRDAEGLVEIEMADIGPDEAGAGEADLGVHVRAVHVNLATGVVDDLADFADGFLEDAVRARVGDHERAEIGGVRGDLRAQVREVDVAVGVAGDGHDGEAGHDGAGGVGAVRGVRDEADGAVRLAEAFLMTADDEEPGVFTGGTGVRLQAHSREAGDLREPFFQLAEDRLITTRLAERREGMELAELGP